MITQVKKSVRSIARQFGLHGDSKEEVGAEQPASWYNAEYRTSTVYGKHYAHSRYYFMWTVIVDRLRRSSATHVLDIGCGSGELALFLYDQGVRCYCGLDFSEAAVEMAARTVPGFEFVIGDARTSDVYKRPFIDAIICTEVLEHVVDDLLIIAQFPRGVRCICSVPDFPYKSHVRHFVSSEQVRERYGAYFNNCDVMTLRCPDRDGVFFLFDGIRNDRR